MRKLLVIILVASMATVSFSLSDTLVYQGKLTSTDGVGVNDTLDMVFRLYDASTGGTMLCVDTVEDVPVVKGLFDVKYEVELDLTEAAGPIYMELEVDANTMTPRVLVSLVPKAMHAIYADSTMFAVHADSLGGYSATQLMPNDLEGAYNQGGPGAGAQIDAISGPVDIRTAYSVSYTHLRAHET